MRPLGRFALLGLLIVAGAFAWRWYGEHKRSTEFLTPLEHQIDMQPSVSPDGKRIR